MMSHTSMLIIMVITSIVISYFFTMTIVLRKNFTHNKNKLYQALLMGAWMSLIMNLTMNGSMFVTVISIGFIIVFTYLIRQQETIDQNQFMLGMIEHHQMAIDMATLVKPKVTDLRLETLVNNIIQTQNQEIEEIRQILRQTE